MIESVNIDFKNHIKNISTFTVSFIEKTENHSGHCSKHSSKGYEGLTIWNLKIFKSHSNKIANLL